ncbi:MAG: AAA family ATPase [Candidatus Bathyarchaeota archaeon]|nr:AAA family ATPase [Candidatus Bathyarchaeum sp.]
MGLAGMPGAGKGVFRKFVQNLGYSVVTMGDVVRGEVKRRNLDPTPENMGKVMLNLRELDGPAAIAKQCVPSLNQKMGKMVVIDGIRSLVEMEEFKKHFPDFVLVAVHSSPQTRYNRLVKRKRSDDPPNWETFIERDLRELGIGMGSVISVADYMLINEGSISQLKNKITQLIAKVLKENE